jgi:hypothetical protein
MRRVFIFCKAILLICIPLPLFAEDCGKADTIEGTTDARLVSLKARYFDDGSIAVRARLSVNPDGGAGSYTVDDHGFTYIANGLSIW